MDACDEFQIAIERRLRGALDEAERPALNAHLVSCATCRSYDLTLAVSAQTSPSQFHRGTRDPSPSVAAQHLRFARTSEEGAV